MKSVGSSIPGQIPVSINTSENSVTKEDIALMFANVTKNLPSQTMCIEIDLTGTKLSVKEKNKNKFGSNYILNDLIKG